MKVLVPLPMNLATLANGRTLRIVNLLTALSQRCDLTCIVPTPASGETLRQHLPAAQAIWPQDSDIAATHQLSAHDLLPELSRASHRVLQYLGFEPGLAKMVQRQRDRADVVFGFDLDTLSYLLLACHERSAGGPAVICDLIDDPWLTWTALPEWQHLSYNGIGGIKQATVIQYARHKLLSLMDGLVAVAPKDAGTLKRATGIPVAVVPNGVMLPSGIGRNAQREPLVIFTGAMQFPPNQAAARWFARRVWPLVLRELEAAGFNPPSANRPGATFAIVGKDPSPRVQQLTGTPGVIVTGAVDNMFAWMSRARVAVAPMISGSGIKNKVLEACAAGCPVVATSHGVGGLPTGPYHGVFVADDPARFAAQVADLLRNPARAAAFGQAGRVMVERGYAWSHMADLLVALFDRLNSRTVRKVEEPRTAVAAELQRGHSTLRGKEIPIHAAS